MATIDEFLASLRSQFGEQEAGRKFEIFCKWFLEHDPEWSKIIDKVWLWDEYPNKWQRQDLGTDLVFKDRDGLIWAVQTKCYAEHRTITKGDVNSFLADTGRKEVSRRLWMQTTNKVEAKAQKTLRGQEKPVILFNLNDFRDANLDFPSCFADLRNAKVKIKPTPEPHQDKAINDAVHGFASRDRGQVIMACGTGKTFTTLWTKEALGADNTLVLLPSLSLLSQTMREWAWASKIQFDILNVCSDKSVGKTTDDMDPGDAPFPVTSQIEEISTFLKKPNPKVVFCTYQSSDLIAQAQLDREVAAFDLAIADEAHRCAGKVDAGFATILDNNKIRATKRLFTTATPRFFGQAIKDAAQANDLSVVGMDDEDVFGPIFHRLTFGQAIEQELLTDYQVVVVGVDKPMVKNWIDDYKIVSWDPSKQTDARTLAAKIGLLKSIKDYDIKRLISFHSRVKSAKEFSDELEMLLSLIDPENRPEGNFLSDYVSGQMNAGDRKEKIDKLKGLDGYARGILTNSRCLAEGVDVPSLDGVAFIDPRGSQIEIIQAVGRAIRKVRGAKIQRKGTIVIPVFVEEGDDFEQALELSDFKPVWDVLKALRAHDEILAATLDQYRTNMARNNLQAKEDICEKIIFDLPTALDPEFSSSLRTVLVEASTASWEFWYGLLQDFKDREGHCLIPSTHIERGFKLGSWAAAQRSQKDSLVSERMEKLRSVGFVFDNFEEVWQQHYNALDAFAKEHGSIHVPYDYVSETGLKLAVWKSYQIRNQTQLSSERKRLLEKIPGWTWDQFFDELWETRYAQLLQFADENGHGSPPATYKTMSGDPLGNWVVIQRKNRAKLDTKKIERLEEVTGWVWSVNDARWKAGLSELINFRQTYGHVNVPFSFQSVNGFNLGQWTSDLRKKYSTNKLKPDQINQLEQISGWIWSVHDAKWAALFQKLEIFLKREGHLRVPQKWKEEGENLGTWVSSQRSAKDTMSPDRRNKLDSIGFIWEAGKGKQ